MSSEIKKPAGNVTASEASTVEPWYGTNPLAREGLPEPGERPGIQWWTAY